MWASSADERLVEEEDVGVARERAGEADALAFAAGEVAGACVAEVADAEAVEHLVGEPVVEGAEADVLGDVEVREERVLLEEVADASLLGWEVVAAARVEPGDAVDGERSLAGPQEAGDDPQHRCLPGPRGPDERGRRPARDGQPDGCYEGAKGMGEVEFERHRENSLTIRRRPALTATSTALIARATSNSRSNCS